VGSKMQKNGKVKKRKGGENSDICDRERGGARRRESGDSRSAVSLDWLVDARARFGPRHQAAFDEDGYVLMPRLLSVEGLNYVRGKVAAIHRGESRAEAWPFVHVCLLPCAPWMLCGYAASLSDPQRGCPWVWKWECRAAPEYRPRVGHQPPPGSAFPPPPPPLLPPPPPPLLTSFSSSSFRPITPTFQETTCCHPPLKSSAPGNQPVYCALLLLSVSA
jgi:hypothetical protein